MKSKLIFIYLKIVVITIFFGADSFGQSISRTVIASAGGTLIAGGSQLNYSIGETVIPSLTSVSNQITQGFEQPGEQINTGTISATLCVGTAITVPFNAIDIGGGNTFTAQLSNASGSFANPVNIGTATGNSSGSINAVIPVNTPLGTNYRIRVIASSPLTYGIDNAANLPISGPIILTAVKSDALLGGNTGSAGITFSPSTCSILWSSGETTNYISNKASGTYTGTVTSPAGCVTTKVITIN